MSLSKLLWTMPLLVILSCGDQPLQPEQQALEPPAPSFAKGFGDPIPIDISPKGMNNKGQIVGFVSPEIVPALWEAGQVTELQTLAGLTQGSAEEINDKGQIVGSLASSTDPEVPVLWETPQSIPTELALLPGDDWGRATGINKDGQVVGWSAGTDWLAGRAVRWDDAASDPVVLPLLPGCVGSMATGINNSGVIVGEARCKDADILVPVLCPGRSDECQKAVVWEGGQVIELATLVQTPPAPTPGSVGTWQSHAEYVNDKGQIVGWNRTNPPAGIVITEHAVLWNTPTEVVDLWPDPTGLASSVALSVNTGGQVAMLMQVGSANHAGVWKDGETTDLGIGWAGAINDHGQVAGYLNGLGEVLWPGNKKVKKPKD